jgi:CheY-like chemotaxis protein
VHLEPPRVLVVDDDATLRQLVVVNLELEGFEVHEAVDGADCLERICEIAPHVVTLDIMMPRVDGWEVASRLRADPRTAGIKVVVLTAASRDTDLRRGARIGVDCYLTKPFDPDDLVGVVQRLVAGQPV